MSKATGRYTSNNKFIAALLERYRKFLVSLKRRPQNIPLVLVAVSFIYYSFNLASISLTTAKLQGKNMGLVSFVTMLLSILCFVCFTNSFPKRKPVNKPMLALFFGMIAIIIFCDLYYGSRISYATSENAEYRVEVTENTLYILKAQKMVHKHVYLLAVTALLTALLPVYGKLLKKINTSLEVEDNGQLEAIEINNED